MLMGRANAHERLHHITAEAEWECEELEMIIGV